MNDAEITLAKVRYGRAVSFAAISLLLAIYVFSKSYDYDGWTQFAFGMLAGALCSMTIRFTVRAASWHVAVNLVKGAEKARTLR